MSAKTHFHIPALFLFRWWRLGHSSQFDILWGGKGVRSLHNKLRSPRLSFRADVYTSFQFRFVYNTWSATKSKANLCPNKSASSSFHRNLFCYKSAELVNLFHQWRRNNIHSIDCTMQHASKQQTTKQEEQEEAQQPPASTQFRPHFNTAPIRKLYVMYIYILNYYYRIKLILYIINVLYILKI